ncbi:MAG: S8 family serine peptidase [bacterium]
MKKMSLVGLVLLLAFATCNARIGPPSIKNTLVPGRDYEPGQVLVKLMPELRQKNVDPALLLSEYKLGLLKEYPELGWNLMAVPEDEPYGVLALIEELMDDPRIENATPNYLLQLHSFQTWTPNDWFYVKGHLWNLDLIGMPEAWAMDTEAPLYGGDPSIIAAVIDTGVAYMDYEDTTSFPGKTVIHAQAPDFSQTNFVPGYNWAYHSEYALDDNGHGTHVAGTIAQSTNNDPSGIQTEYSAAGIAFNTSIMPLKTAPKGGSSLSTDVAEAIVFAADHGAHVINMSLGSGGVGLYPPDNVQFDACNYAYEKGLVIFASAGNDADVAGWSPDFNGIGYPAAYPSVIAVGAVNSRLTPGDPKTEYRSAFSEYGYTSELFAPSGDFTSGDHDKSGKIDHIYQQVVRVQPWPDLTKFVIRGEVGTSMACPHATGTAALLLAYGKQMGWNLTNEDVRARMAASAVDLNRDEYPGYDYQYGFGRIDVPAAMTIDLKPNLVVREAKVFEASGQGNGNYRAEAGETVSMNVDLMPLFADASGVQATITSNDPYVTVLSSNIHYPDVERFKRISPVGSVVLSISANCPLNYRAEFQAVISCDQEADRTEVFHATLTPPRVLYWKDDRYNGNTKWPDKCLLDALDNAGIDYDIYVSTDKIGPDATEQFRYPWEDIEFLKLPTYEKLREYDVVIWFVGQPGISRRELAQTILPEVVKYLDGGGNILITGHELMFNMARPASGREDRITWINAKATPNPNDIDEYNHWFVYNYLHIAAVEHDNWYAEVKGSAVDPITRNMNTQTLNLMTYNKKLEYNWWPDNIVPRGNAIPMMYSGPPVRPADSYPDAQKSFDEDQPDKMAERACAVRYSGHYRLIMCPYPIEAASNPEDFFIPAVNWLLTGQETAPEILVKIDTDYRRHRYNYTHEPPHGDPFNLHAYTYNPGPPVTCQRWLLMQIFDMFWAWPSWVELDKGFDFKEVTVPTGFSKDVFLEFEWIPDIHDTFDEIYFWFAHLTPEPALLGTYDVCVTGYFD